MKNGYYFIFWHFLMDLLKIDLLNKYFDSIKMAITTKQILK